MSTPRRVAAALTIALVALFLAWSCAPDLDEAAFDPSTTRPGDSVPGETPPLFVPVTGGTNDDGQPEPPPIHAVFSVIVRGDTSWEPFGGPELNTLDEAAARAIAGRLDQLDAALRQIGVPASIELAYGPAAALCRVDPGLFDRLEAGGHRLAIHAWSRGEAFRAHAALGGCGRTPTTASGLAPMADPNGPGPPTGETVADAMAVLSVLDVAQVVGRVSPLCTELGLAEPVHGYGTGSFTAPWRSAWLDGNPCTDTPAGRIVVIDQTALAPVDGAERIDGAALAILSSRTEQVLAYALDLRFGEPGDLPHPGVVTWGVTVRLDDLVAPPPSTEVDGDEVAGEAVAGDDDGDGDGGGDDTPEAPPDLSTAPLSDETLAALVALAEERWHPSVERGRLRWMLPEAVAAIIRPLPTGAPDGEGTNGS